MHAVEEVTEARTRRPACPKPPEIADTPSSFTSALGHVSTLDEEFGLPSCAAGFEIPTINPTTSEAAIAITTKTANQPRRRRRDAVRASLINNSSGSKVSMDLVCSVGVIVIVLNPWTYDTIHSSSMQTLKIDKDEPVPLHDQVAAEIRRAIADGEAAQGERLPPAVDLATVLGVNKNTVIRALHILRDEELLDFTRGRGVRVVGTPQRGALMTRIDELLTFARAQGYRQDEVVALIQARS